MYLTRAEGIRGLWYNIPTMVAWTKTYKPRTFDPHSLEPFKVSRSKIDFFMDCPRCFYLEARLGHKRPSMPSFTLNIAVDALLKKEFDAHRVAGTRHPLCEQYGVDAVPFRHAQLDQWRENFIGVQYLDAVTNLLVFGAVDDVWVNPAGELLVVDYKATSKDGAITQLDDSKWHDQYRRQMEVYQWLLRRNGFTVSSTGYFVYVNGKKDRKAFDGKLEFDVSLIPYTGSDTWVGDVLQRLKLCLQGPLPPLTATCEFCVYRAAVQVVEQGPSLAPASAPIAVAAKAPKLKRKPAPKPVQNTVLF